MSSEACTLTVAEVEELRDALRDAGHGIVRILAEADAARNGVGVCWELIFEAVGRISTALTTVDDTIDHKTTSEAQS